MSALARKLDILEPRILAKMGEVQDSIYGVVDKINEDGTPHFIRRWKGRIGHMKPTLEEPTIYVIEKLEPAILKHKKYKMLFGGRAGTKSIAGMDSMVGDVNAVGSKVYVLRESMKSLKNSIYAGIKSRIGTLKMGGFTPVPSQWEIQCANDGLISFGGMRNIKDIKSSFEYKFIFMEEADSTSQETLDILGPTLRGVEGAELWGIWNPGSSNDPMSTEFIVPFQDSLDRDGYYEDDYHLIIKVGFEDNPWFFHDESLRTEYEKDKQKKEEGRMSAARFNHIWHGSYNDDVENSLIETDHFDACIDAHLKLGFEPKGSIVATHDPSDEGKDAKGIAIRHGVVVTMAEELESLNGNTGMDDACGIAIRENADSFGWDCDGMGALLREQVSANFKDKRISTFMFKGSEGVHHPDAVFGASDSFGYKDAKLNKDLFKNKRSQNYTNLAVRCRKTYEAVVLKKYHDPDDLISFSSDIKHMQKLRSELCRMPLKPNGNGMIQLYSKDEMQRGILLPNGQKLKLPSQNIGDCIMMLFDASSTARPLAGVHMRRPTPNRPIRRK